MRTFLRKIAVALCILACEGLVVMPAAQAAPGMQAILSGMYTATGAPTVAQMPSGTVLSMGYLATRNQILNPNIIAFAPPNISAGCGGINMFFGSWSFISGQELQQLLTAIGQAAGPFLFEMAIQAMCSQCSSVLNALQKDVQKMNSLAKNSCQLAAGIYSGHGEQMLTNMFKSAAGMSNASNGNAPDTFASWLGLDNPTQNKSMGWAAAAQNVATSWGYSALGASTATPQSGNGACSDFATSGNSMRFGNMTWKALVNNNGASVFPGGTSGGAVTDEILMSLAGTNIVLPSAPTSVNVAGSTATPANGTSTSNTQAQNGGQSIPPVLSLTELVDGTPNAPVMRCNDITAPSPSGSGTSTYSAFYGTCPSGTLSPLGCMNVTSSANTAGDPSAQTLGSLGYIGIKNEVHCALFGTATDGSTSACTTLGSPNGVVSDLTTVAGGGTAGWAPIEMQVLNMAPQNILPLLEPMAKYPTAVQGILIEMEPYIIANIAAQYGEQVLYALRASMQNNGGGWKEPDWMQPRMQHISDQVNGYVEQVNGSVNKYNEMRTYVNAYLRSEHSAVPGVSATAGR